MTNPEQDERWFAYFLGELPENERASVEAEMTRAPERAAEVRAVVEGLQSWAAAPAPYSPYAAAGIAEHTREHGVARLLRAPLGLAAAALLMFAFTQAQFTVSYGERTISWGQPAPVAAPETDPAVTALAERLVALESTSEDAKDLIETLAVETLVLKEQLNYATTNLVARQEEEALARYRDVQQLMYLSDRSNEVGLAAWTDPSASDE